MRHIHLQMIAAFSNRSLHIVNTPLSRVLSVLLASLRWYVRESNGERIAPGNNIFSSDAEYIWVDTSGYLHLTIKNNSDGDWVCTQASLTKPLGFGTYYFTVRGPNPKQDRYVVAGGFT